MDTAPPSPRSPGLRRILAILGMVRTLWDGFGLTLILIVIGLFLWVGGRTVVRALTSEPPLSPSPIESAPWGAQFTEEFEHSLHMRWEPFLYWRRRLVTGDYVNVDARGLRRTVIPGTSDSIVGTVFFLGGSTMWGTGQRDAYTIPSLVSRHLDSAGWRGLDIVNYGESGYVFTQEVIQLMVALRDGARPDVVVFYDGINDLAAGLMNDRGGLPQNESRRALEFSIGRLLSLRGWREMQDVLASGVARYRHPLGLTADTLLRSDHAASDLAQRVVESYASTSAVVEALAQRYDFRVVYVWQPTPGTTTDKVLTPYESALFRADALTGLSRFLLPLSRAAAVVVDSAMEAHVPGRFLNLSALFNRDTSAVWVDAIGHVTEAANEQIARAMAPIILHLLGPVPK